MLYNETELFEIKNYKKNIINNYKKYDEIYFDLDLTIRMYSNDTPINNVVSNINKLKSLGIKIIFITNNLFGYNYNKKYLDKYKFKYDKLLTPIDNFNISKEDIKNGYFIRNNKLFLLKFPIINYELFDIINKTKKIYYIDDSYYNSSKHIEHSKKDIKIPFVGYFLDIIRKTYNNINFICIGKQKMNFPNIKNKNILMVGDSYQDFLFAKNHNIDFKLVSIDKKNNITNINNIIDSIINNI